MHTLRKYDIRLGNSADTLALFLFTILILTPFFFVSSGNGFIFAPILGFDTVYTRTSAGVPVAMAGIAFLALVFLYRLARHEVHITAMPVVLSLVLIMWMTFAMLFGLQKEPGLTLVYYIQTVLPLGLLVALLTLPFPRIAMKTALLAIPVIGSGSIVILLVVAAYLLSKHNLNIAFSYLSEMFYGAKNVHPLVVVAGFAVILWQFSTARRSFSRANLWLMFVIHASYIVIIWSRTGLLMIGALFGFWLIAEAVRKKWTADFMGERAVLTVIMISVTGAALSAGGLSIRRTAEVYFSKSYESNIAPTRPAAKTKKPKMKASDPVVGKKGKPAKRRQQTKKEIRQKLVKNLKHSDNRRVLLAKGAIDRVISSPIVGDAFTPLPSGTVLFGRTEATRKIYPSHNQFIDIAVRSGLPGLLLYIGLIYMVGRVLWRGLARDPDLALCGLFFLATVIIGSMFQSYLVVTQPAATMYLLLALVMRLLEAPDMETESEHV